jgi:hypothetical protein
MRRGTCSSSYQPSNSARSSSGTRKATANSTWSVPVASGAVPGGEVSETWSAVYRVKPLTLVSIRCVRSEGAALSSRYSGVSSAAMSSRW